MRNPRLLLTAAWVLIALCVTCALNRSSAAPAVHAPPPLTGKWDGNDGGYYYLHQVGDTLYGYGESNTQVEMPLYAEPDITEPAWATVLVGKITAGCVHGTWARVPRGRDAGKYGRFVMAVYADGNMLSMVHEFGGFGATRLIRIAYIDRGSWASRKLPKPPAHACAGLSASALFPPATGANAANVSKVEPLSRAVFVTLEQEMRS